MREQIRVRVDTAAWEALKQGEESNTALLARIVREWQEQKAVLASLTEIDTSPSQALGRLLLSYELLQQATVSIQPPELSPPIPAVSPTVSTHPAPTIGGLENNSDDW
mgnify:CR=1 FL=1